MAAWLHEHSGFRAGVCVIAALALLAVAACGDDDSSSPSSPASDGGSDAGKIEKDLQALYEGIGYSSPPTTGPPPAKNKRVWVISCGQIINSCAIPSNSAHAAAKLLGWDSTLFDGKLDPNTQANGIRQAVAAGADGIMLEAVDCEPVRSALQQARKAGVVIVAASSADCSDTGGPSMFDHRIKYWIGDWPAYIREWGAAQGRWLAGVTKGKAKIIEFAENDLVITRLAQAGFEDAIKDCSGCEILDKVVFTGAQIGTSLQQMAQQALLQHPDANAVYAPYDGVMIAGIGQAVKASGRNDEIFAVGGEGYAENMDLVRENGGQDGGIGVGIRGTAFWEGYANADALNRLFNDVEPEVSGIGVQAFDRDHNMPASGPYQAPIDFVSAYKKAWGID